VTWDGPPAGGTGRRARARAMRPFARYLLLQVPGWCVVAALLLWLWPATGRGGWLGAGLLGLWIAKDLLAYPLLRRAYESGVETGSARLIGLRGLARQPIDPRGYVEVRGELWRAELAPGEAPIAPGTPVEVRSASGLTLVIARAAGD
jgi:membrane protein implicated in regulation of membrane protease activity